MKVLAFDTETTGLPENMNAPMTDSAKWPYIIQLSFILFDTEQKEILEYSDHIIKLAGTIPISPASVSIHNITRERSEKEGIHIRAALQEFTAAMKEADLIIAHNIAFDKKLILAELSRHQLPNCFVRANTYNEPEPIPEYCTMKETINLCKIANPVAKYADQYKWPRLNELHKHLFHTEPTGTHNAIADVMICLRAYVYLNFQYDIAVDEGVKIVFRCLYANYCLGAAPPHPRRG
jgi:DNA polymerase-3 subunit epsilon